MNSGFIAKKLQEHFDTLSTKNVRFITYTSPSIAGNVVQLSAQCIISEFDIVRESNPVDLYFKALNYESKNYTFVDNSFFIPIY